MDILQHNLVISNKKLDYAWFKVRRGQETWYRAVVLRELTALTLLDLENANMLGTATGAMRGMYGAEIDFQYLVLGIFHPDHIGICQLYGTSADGQSMDEAGERAMRQIQAVEATMANFEHSRMENPLADTVNWYIDFIFQRTQSIQVVLGYPDPRIKRRGSSLQEGQIREAGDDLAQEQNEMIFRGLAKMRTDFVYQAMSRYIPRSEIVARRIRFDRLISNYASRQESSRSISFGLGIPILASLGQSLGGGVSSSQAQTQSVSDSTSHGWGSGHTDSRSTAKSVTTSEGIAESWSETQGSSHAQSQGTNWGHTDSTAHTISSSQGTSHTVSDGVSASTAHTESSSTAMGWGSSQSEGASHTDGSTIGGTLSHSMGTHIGASAEPAGLGLNMGLNSANGYSLSGSKSVSDGISSSHGTSQNTSISQGSADSTSSGTSHVESSGSMSSTGTADSTGSADSRGGSMSTSQAQSSGTAHSWGYSKSTSYGTTTTTGSADSTSENFGTGHAAGSASTQGAGTSASQALSGGFSAGLAPSISIGESWRAVDRVAVSTTQLLDQVSGILNECSAEGGYLSQILIFTANDTHAREAAALVPQAFHGPAMPTPVFTRTPDQQDVPALCSQAVTGFPGVEGSEQDDPTHGALGTKYATVLPANRFAAYISPALIREGTCRILHPLPPELAFYASSGTEKETGIYLGSLYSPTTRDLTTSGVYMKKSRLMHTVFAANTGFGKSVAAQSMVYAANRVWKMRVVVLDFGFAWRKLLNAQGLEGRVDIRQLRPDGVRPLRWNPLQVGTFTDPEVHIREFVDMFGTVAQLGQKQQQHRFLNILRRVFVEHGVMVNDPRVRSDPKWGLVQPDEEVLPSCPAGTPVASLDMESRQRLIVQRSSRVSLATLSDYINSEYEKLPSSDRVVRPMLEGLLVRLMGLVTGPVAAQFGASSAADPACSIEDLGRDNNSITILEGGKFLDSFSKAFLLGWASRMIYVDMVARRERGLNSGDPDLLIVYEEANIIFSGLEKQAEDAAGPSVAEQFSNMFRDSRKYGCYFLVITQSPSLLPPAIFSSCNNLIIGYITNPKDKDLVLASAGRSEKGFHDEAWRRFFSDLGVGMFVARLPYDSERENQQLFLFRPYFLDVPEPTDEEIQARLGRIILKQA